jgi:hypothetical protein
VANLHATVHGAYKETIVENDLEASMAMAWCPPTFHPAPRLWQIRAAARVSAQDLMHERLP